MKTISPALQAHLNQEVTSICSCWKVVRQDGKAFFFTDHDQDLVIDGDTYTASFGYNRTAIANAADLSVDNLDILGVVNSSAITDDELRVGLFDLAKVYVFIVNWADLSQGILRMRRGWFGEVIVMGNGQFHTEVRGLAQGLSHDFLETYTPECKADFCDHRCKLNIADFSRPTSIQSDSTRYKLHLEALTVPPQGLIGGLVRFTSGANNGKTVEIIGWTDGVADLFDGVPFKPEIGDTVEVVQACDKRRETCAQYGNILNFRGFPDVPGMSTLLAYPNGS